MHHAGFLQNRMQACPPINTLQISHWRPRSRACQVPASRSGPCPTKFPPFPNLHQTHPSTEADRSPRPSAILSSGCFTLCDSETCGSGCTNQTRGQEREDPQTLSVNSHPTWCGNCEAPLGGPCSLIQLTTRSPAHQDSKFPASMNAGRGESDIVSSLLICSVVREPCLHSKAKGESQTQILHTYMRAKLLM